MRILLLIAGTGMLAGCSVEQRGQTVGAADINAAAQAAQGDIDTYAANTLAPAPEPVGVRATGSARAAAPQAAPSAPAVDDDAGRAKGVADVYFRRIATHDYAGAYALWEDKGRASGMTRQAFVDSFGRYASYRAVVGAPGRVDAGAGQRYVEVPVTVSGQLTDQRPFALAGTLVLHRTADIDGATAEQRQWHIRDSTLRPRPGAVAQTQPAALTASYRCAGETRLSVRFDRDAGTATVRSGGHEVAVLDEQRPASGIWYKGGGYELRGKGRDADYSAPGQPAIACSAE